MKLSLLVVLSTLSLLTLLPLVSAQNVTEYYDEEPDDITKGADFVCDVEKDYCVDKEGKKFKANNNNNDDDDDDDNKKFQECFSGANPPPCILADNTIAYNCKDDRHYNSPGNQCLYWNKSTDSWDLRIEFDDGKDNDDKKKSSSSNNNNDDNNDDDSYQLIIYLDGATHPNAIGDNFDIVVYNSNDRIIFYGEPTIDFYDSHQKISPKKGWSIDDKAGQHPNQITVCAQQSYSLSGERYLHDDCYPIKQNNEKTYWYTIFDYTKIDGFEGAD